MLAVKKRILTRIAAHQAAYRAGILHRDISTSNIMLLDSKTNQGGMLIDWDLSKVIDPDKPDSAHRLTHTVSV
jgi:RIO-like serine/threonine protein kinase